MGDPTAQLARLPRATPGGDPAAAPLLRARQAAARAVRRLRGRHACSCDLGISQRSRRTVAAELRDAIPWTLLLVGVGTLLATLLGTWLGVIAATRRGTATDDGLLGFSLFTYAAPEYWIGIILILLFAVAIPLFPAGQQVTPGADFDSWFAKARERRRATWCCRSTRSR